MRRENGLFAGEMSGHYYFRENFYADNGVIPFLLVLEHLSTHDKPFSEIMARTWPAITCRESSITTSKTSKR